MHVLRFAAANAVVCLIVACGGSSPTGTQTNQQTQTATITGTISSSLGGGIASASVTVTPTGASALPAATTSASGTYTVSNVPAGGGSVAVSNVPTGCTAPTAATYSVSAGGSQTVNMTVTCPPPVGTTTLNPGEAALFASSPNFATNLTIAPNGVYMMAIVNTDTSSAAMEDFTLSGSFTVSGAGHVTTRPPQTLRMQRLAPRAAAGPRLDPRLARDLRYLKAAERNHVRYMERQTRVFGQIRAAGGVGANALQSQIRAAIHKSLVGTQVGDVNTILVPVPSVDTPTVIGARTVYVGQHVQVVADTSLTNWPAQYRPDSSYYTTFGQEYDTLTYAKHMLTYIGDPLQYDNQLSSVGKVTVVLTPVLNGLGSGGTQGGGQILAFVQPCDLVPTQYCPNSNQTEMFYHLVPDANYDLDFWQRELRPTAAHETKHIVSLAAHLRGNFLEQVWLEEGLAQISSEIWGRNYNAATWRGNAGFAETLGCEVNGYPAACNTPTSPYTFLGSHMAWLHDWLQGLDSIPETLNGTTPGRYGAGWSIARWTVDQFANGSSPASEAAIIKSLINNVNYTGFDNISNVTGLSSQTLLLNWSLATALDTASLIDSSTFLPTDVKNTVPSFDFRNIFSVAGNGGLYGPAAPLRADQVSPGTINGTISGIPGTEPFYVEFLGTTAGTQSLQLTTASGGALSSSSGWRVAIIRIQ